jgi:hypothetical protein
LEIFSPKKNHVTLKNNPKRNSNTFSRAEQKIM